MSYSYSTPVTYGPQSQTQYNNYDHKKKSAAIPITIAGTVAGGAAGGTIGAVINPYFKKNSEVKDILAQKAYINYLESAADAEKTLYNQGQTVLKQLKSAETANEVKELLNNNPEVKSILDEALTSGISDANLKTNKDAIKNKIETVFQEKYTVMKNTISKCWDANGKKWVKPADVNDGTFNAIEKAAKGVKWRNIGIGTGIGAAALGITALVAQIAYQHQKNSAQQ